MSDGRPPEPVAGKPEMALRVAENVAYLAVGVLLLVGATAMVVSIAYHLAVDLGDGAEVAVTEALNGLLLVFILLELLAGVRATIVERKLVAEPFLVAGIIASIKEIILVSLEAKELTGSSLDDAMVQIAVLGAVVLLLALASLVIRRKEREPEEG